MTWMGLAEVVSILVSAAVGVLVGVVIGWAAWKGKVGELLRRLPSVLLGLLRAAQRALLGALLIAIFAGVLVGMVALARAADTCKDLWSLAIAATFLLGVTLLLYATGAKQRTAKQRIVIGGGTPARVAAGEKLSADQYQRLPRSEVEKVQTRYEATKAFEIPGATHKIERDAVLDENDFNSLPADKQAKFEPKYITTQRVTWDPKVRKPAAPGEVITSGDYEKLTEPEKKKVQRQLRAKEDVEYAEPATQIDEHAVVDAQYVLNHLKLVQKNAKPVHRAREPVEVPAEDAKVIEEGAAVDRKTYQKMSTKERGQVREQRGLYFRGLYVGADGRWSTSKMQVLLWTYAVLLGLAALFVFGELLDQKFDVDPGSGKTLGEFGDMEIQEQYLLLLGGPFAAAVLAKATTQSKVADGTLVKAPETEASGAVDGLREVISNDAGSTDIMDFQYFFFNVLALVVFAVSFIGDVGSGLPELPWFLVGLTSTSALAYATKKSIERSRPQITGVVPECVRPGESLDIEGRYLVTPSRRPPEVAIAGRPVPKSDVEVTAGSARDDVSRVRITVPKTTKPAPDTRLVVVPEGSAVSAERVIEVLGPKIDQVQPGTIPTVAGTPVLVFGEGFGDLQPPPNEVRATLGTVTLDVGSWSDSRIDFRVSDVSGVGTQRSGPADLRIAVTGVGIAQTPVTLVASATVIESVVPPTITLTGGPVISVVGQGFGGPQSSGEVLVGAWPLVELDWRDELIRGTLQVDPVPEEFKEETPVSLVVRPKDRPHAAKEVKVRK